MPPLFCQSTVTMLWFFNAVDRVGGIWPDNTIFFTIFFFTAHQSNIKSPFPPNSFPIRWDMFLSQLKIDWSRGASADMASGRVNCFRLVKWSPSVRFLLLCIINLYYYFFDFHCYYYYYCFQLVKWYFIQVLIIVYYAGGWRLHQAKDLLLATREK